MPQYLTTELVLPKGVREQFEAEQAAARAAAEAAAREQQAAAQQAASEGSVRESAGQPAAAASAPNATAAPAAKAAQHARHPKHAAASVGFKGVPTVEELYANSGAKPRHKTPSQKIPLMTDLIGAEGARKRAEGAPRPASLENEAKVATVDAVEVSAAVPVADKGSETADANAAVEHSASQLASKPEPDLAAGVRFVDEPTDQEPIEADSSAQGDLVGVDRADADPDSDPEASLGSSEDAEQDPELNESDQDPSAEEADAEGDAEADGLTDEQDEALIEDEPAPRAPRSMAWRVAGIVFCTVLVVVALGLGTFGYDRWLHGSDEANLQGTWRIEDSDATVTITDTQIIFAEDATYDYKMDPTTKSLSLTLAGLSGQAHYCFSFDKDTLMFADGDPGTALTSAANDFPWWIAQVGEEVLSVDSSKAVPEGGVVLHRAE